MCIICLNYILLYCIRREMSHGKTYWTRKCLTGKCLRGSDPIPYIFCIVYIDYLIYICLIGTKGEL